MIDDRRATVCADRMTVRSNLSTSVVEARKASLLILKTDACV